MSKKKIIIVLSIIILVLIVAAFGTFFYFFRTSVKINSEFGVDGISIVDESGKVIHKDSSHFSHFSIYGKYEYRFIVKGHKVLVDYVKTNNYEHNNIEIDIKGDDSQSNSIIVIDVKRNGILEKTEEFNLNDQDMILISLGP